jgi:hypothetical protein
MTDLMTLMINLLRIWKNPKNPCKKCIVNACCQDACKLKYKFRYDIYPFDIHPQTGLIEFYLIRWALFFSITAAGVVFIRLIESFLNIEV